MTRMPKLEHLEKPNGLYASFHAGGLRTVCSNVMLLYAKELAGAFLAFMEGKWRVMLMTAMEKVTNQIVTINNQI